jgi:hypothetical protein
MGDRQELEALWRSRVTDAKLRVDFAHLYLKEVQGDIAADAVPMADGNFAFQKALLAENFALAEYNRVLRIYTDLIAHGIIPDEDDWLKHKGAGW